MRFSSCALRKYLLAGQLSRNGCLRRPIHLQRTRRNTRYTSIRCLTTTSESPANPASKAILPQSETVVPLRKELKEQKRLEKQLAREDGGNTSNTQESLEDWELTVGIEIHAQLNTPRKLFSSAASTIGGEPNRHVALFDVGMPGSQPQFQKECLIPAIRAALALNCPIEQVSTFDRKHYFHWDQPNGYQITQYYRPLAKDGYIKLFKHDGIAEEDGDEVTIGIKQIQMEQDTAKTIDQSENVHLLDFNRAGITLIEIITLPQIHHPSTAAALVRKVQILLNAVDACVLGMESGGLRADINVSVKRREETNSETVDSHSYAGITGLGQRTEIKNLSSFKAVKAAIIAERDRQISVIESGGVIESETRGWTVGSTETKRLRGKEGEVDYRYMPDADIPPIRIGSDLIEFLKQTMGVLPDEELKILNEQYGLTVKDALTLVSLDDGARAEYFYDVVDELAKLDESITMKDAATLSEELQELPENGAKIEEIAGKWGKAAGNWILHEIGGLTSTFESMEAEADTSLPKPKAPEPADLAKVIHLRSTNQITASTAKKLVSLIFHNPSTIELSSVSDIITENKWWFTPLSQEESVALAKEVIQGEQKAWADVLKGAQGKIMFLVGRMMRTKAGEEGRVVAKEAGDVLRGLAENKWEASSTAEEAVGAEVVEISGEEAPVEGVPVVEEIASEEILITEASEIEGTEETPIEEPPSVEETPVEAAPTIRISTEETLNEEVSVQGASVMKEIIISEDAALIAEDAPTANEAQIEATPIIDVTSTKETLITETSQEEASTTEEIVISEDAAPISVQAPITNEAQIEATPIIKETLMEEATVPVTEQLENEEPAVVQESTTFETTPPTTIHSQIKNNSSPSPSPQSTNSSEVQGEDEAEKGNSEHGEELGGDKAKGEDVDGDVK